MKYVFVTDELPRPGTAGHLAVNHAVIGWLQAQGHDVVVLLVGARLGRPVERYGLAPVAGPKIAGWGDFVVARSPMAALRIIARATLRLLKSGTARRFWKPARGAQAVLGSFITPAAAAWCARYIGRTRPDAVLVDTIFRAPVLRAAPGARGVIIAHDLFYLRHRALLSAGYQVQPASLTRDSEAELLNLAAAIGAIQPDEASGISAMCPDRHVFTMPMPAIAHPRPAGVERLADRLVFVGSAALPNLDGLRWFLDSVWPQLRRLRPSLTLDIVGDCGAALARLPEGVNRLGRVKSLSTVLHRAALAIAPLRVGSGLKIKLLDYARHGLMTVATPASLAGFAADPASPFIAASGEIGFAAAIIRQLGEVQEEARAIAYVDRHYGLEASFAGLAAALGPVQPEQVF